MLRDSHPGGVNQVTPKDKQTKENVKIIADHIKSLVFILAEEKILPIKRDRGRIIRTLIRRLLTSCYVLKIDPKKLLLLLIDEVIKMYSKTYPEIKNSKNTVLEIISYGEEKFQKTLERGKRRIEKYLEGNKIRKIGDKEKEYFRIIFGIPEKLIPLFNREINFAIPFPRC